jgi:SAM-dependent methyltransferase
MQYGKVINEGVTILEFNINAKYITSNREPFFTIATKYIKDGDKILDIGSGDGCFSETIGRYDVYQLDSNIESITELKNRFPNCYHANLPDIPFPDNLFDIIHSSHVIEHLSPEKLYDTVKEIDRCLKPGGYLILSAPLQWSEFYDDLSHVKPYNTKVFEKYLCWGLKMCCTRPLISAGYTLIERVYRYHSRPYEVTMINNHFRIITIIINLIRWVIFLLGFRSLEKSGFTIVLHKTA